MKISIFYFLLQFFVFFAFAKAQSQQTCNCKDELAFIDSHITEMTSFKKQIKGDHKEAYEQTLNELSKEVTRSMPIAECYRALNILLSQVKDKHAHIKHIKPSILASTLLTDKDINQYRKSKSFKNHPRYDKSLTSLEKELKKAPSRSIEGVYHREGVFTIGVVKNGNLYSGVVLASQSPLWMPGQIAYTIIPNGKGMYDVMTSDIPGGTLRFIRALYLHNGTLWHLKKENASPYAEVSKENGNWYFKQISPNTQYLYMGSFSNSEENVAAFTSFYNSHKSKITAQNIIIDLRNNVGGNSKYSDPFYKIFKKSKANVYVITNFWSASNSEQFTLKLKSLKNTTHLGMRTYGAIAYGSNYGKLLESPSGLFAIYPTDMNFHKYIDYEYVGIQPDIVLDYNEDWIKQTLDYIKQQDAEY